MKICKERIIQMTHVSKRSAQFLLKSFSAPLCTPSSELVDKRTKLTGIPKAYNAAEFEEKIALRWKNRKGRTGPEYPLFRMALPPPNITGKLHLGHALTVAIQDSIVRLKLMTGSNIEWIPGFDHAGIATHSVVQRKLASSSKPAAALDASALSTEIQSFARLNQEAITKQLNLLGALLNWEQSYYTLDEKYSEAVREAFIHLFEAGTICRGDEIVNWSCKLGSTISDVEVDRVSFVGKTSIDVPGYDHPVDFGLLYLCAYIVENSGNSRSISTGSLVNLSEGATRKEGGLISGYGYCHSVDQCIIVATSRPETMFGDVAVAIHPNHPLYSKYIGSNVINPVNGKRLPVIGDSHVKLDFGTGALKVTPAHDKVDFTIGRAHELTPIKILTPDGKMNEHCNDFKGLGRFTARFEVLNFLTNMGALKDIREYDGTIGLCSRTKDVIEPMLLPHWFLKTGALSQAIKSAIERGEIIVKPDNQKQILLHALAQPHDWCLSRQIQWGHPVPAYFHKDHPDKWVAAQNMEGALTKLKEKLESDLINREDIRQDNDVLDTWFSSALVPLVTTEWPNYLELKPLTLMETGADILIFWVWRMLLMGLALTQTLPFNNVLLHGIVRDHCGRKMSKSLGNVIDPLHIIKGIGFKDMLSEAKASLESGELTSDEYSLKVSGIKKDYSRGLTACGADGLRFALLAQDISDVDIKLNTEYLENCKHFCNKLWQGMRFYMLHEEEGINHPTEIANPIACLQKLPLSDRWILACLSNFVKEYENAVVKCQFHLATESIRRFFLLNYCDVYLELIKKDMQNGILTELHMMVMRYVFLTGLKLAHPFLPFVTEEIWHRMTQNGKAGLLLDQTLPSVQEVSDFENTQVQELMRIVLRVTKEIRHFRIKFLQGIKNPQFYVETDREDIDLNLLVEEIKALSRAQVEVGMFGDAHKPDMMAIVIELEQGNCRVAFPRASIVKLPARPAGQGKGTSIQDAGKLIKLLSQMEKLKKQYESINLQQYGSPEIKAKLKRRMELLQEKINRTRGSSVDSSRDSES